MKKKKAKFVEPETMVMTLFEYTNENSVAYGRLSSVGIYGRTRDVPGRFIRERDYQRLLKAARKTRRSMTPNPGTEQVNK